MKKFILLSSLFIGVCWSCYASPLVVKNIEELRNDLAARTISRVDVNNKPCALIRINLPTMDELRFSDAVVGEVSYMPGEYIVYVSPDATTLSYACKGERTTINFSDFGINIEGKKSYRITLGKEEQTTTKNATSAYISANYDNMIVLVDGIPMGETPLTIESIEPGRHTISVPNTEGYTMRDQIIDIKEGKENRFEFQLYEETYEPVEIFRYFYNDSVPGEFIVGIKSIREGDKEGVCDYMGKIIVPCIFDDVTLNNHHKYFMVRNDGKQGVFVPDKGLIVPCIYYWIFELEHGFFRCKKSESGKDYYGLWDSNFNEIFPCVYSSIDIPVFNRKNSRFIYAGRRGHMETEVYGYDGKLKLLCSVPSILTSYSLFNEGYWIEGNALINIHGEKVDLPTEYFAEDFVSSNLFPVKSGTTWGYMNTKLELMIPDISYKPYPCIGGTIIIQDKYSKLSIFNTEENRIIDGFPQSIEGVTYIQNNGEMSPEITPNSSHFVIRALIEVDNAGIIGLKIKTDNNTKGIYSTHGIPIIPCGLYDEIAAFDYHDNLCFFCYVNDQCDVYDLSGKKLLSLSMDGYAQLEPYKYENEICYFRIKEKDKKRQMQMLDKDLNVLVTFPENYTINQIDGGIIQIVDTSEDNFSYGFVNIHGKMLANSIFGHNKALGTIWSSDAYYSSDAYLSDLLMDRPISDGLAVLNIGDRYGLIDINGNVVLPLVYTAVTPFENGISYVRDQEGNWSKIYRKDL